MIITEQKREMKITIETTVDAPLERVWSAWTTPEDITQWNAASDDWCCPSAKSELRVGGEFCYRMEARDGSAGFDFEGKFTRVEPQRRIEFVLGNSLGAARVVVVEFEAGDEGVIVRETFDADEVHSVEQQRQGWQSILDRFKRHVEGRQ